MGKTKISTTQLKIIYDAGSAQKRRDAFESDVTATHPNVREYTPRPNQQYDAVFNYNTIRGMGNEDTGFGGRQIKKEEGRVVVLEKPYEKNYFSMGEAIYKGQAQAYQIIVLNGATQEEVNAFKKISEFKCGIVEEHSSVISINENSKPQHIHNQIMAEFDRDAFAPDVNEAKDIANIVSKRLANVLTHNKVDEGFIEKPKIGFLERVKNFFANIFSNIESRSNDAKPESSNKNKNPDPTIPLEKESPSTTKTEFPKHSQPLERPSITPAERTPDFHKQPTATHDERPSSIPNLQQDMKTNLKNWRKADIDTALTNVVEIEPQNQSSSPSR